MPIIKPAPSYVSVDLNVEREVVGGEKVIRVSFGHWSGACIFLCLWLIMWTFVCYNVFHDTIFGPFYFKLWVALILAFVVEVFVAGTILLMIFGRTVITFRSSGGTKFTGVGKYGVSREFTFPVKGEIGTDEVVTSGRHGTTTVYRLVVKTQFDLDGPRVIYSSVDSGLIDVLYNLATEAADSCPAPQKEKESAEDAAEDARTERADRNLLAAKPPEGLAVTRDLEGRIFVVFRRVAWALAIVLALVMASVAVVLWQKFSNAPKPMLVAVGILQLFPLAGFLFALFGKRTMTLDHGEGTAFVGVGPIGIHRRFKYGVAFDVRIADGWPDDVKPYLAAILRHPESVSASF